MSAKLLNIIPRYTRPNIIYIRNFSVAKPIESSKLSQVLKEAPEVDKPPPAADYTPFKVPEDATEKVKAFLANESQAAQAELREVQHMVTGSGDFSQEHLHEEKHDATMLSQGVEKVTDYVKEKLHDVKEAIKDKLDIPEKAEDKLQGLKETKDHLKQEVSGKADQVKNKVKDTAQNVKETAHNVKERVKSTAGGLYERGKEKAQDEMSNVAEKARAAGLSDKEARDSKASQGSQDERHHDKHGQHKEKKFASG